MEGSAENHNIYEVLSSRKQSHRKWKVSSSSCNRCQCSCLQCLNHSMDWRQRLKVHFKDDLEVSNINIKQMSKRLCSYLQLDDSVESVYIFLPIYQTLSGLWKMKQNKEVDGVAVVNANITAGVALLWSGVLQAKDHWDSTFICHPYKQTSRNALLPSVPGLNPRTKSPNQILWSVLGTEKWGWDQQCEVSERETLPSHSSHLPSIPSSQASQGWQFLSGSGGCFCSCKCCLRHKVLATDWKYFEFWFSKSALNLIPFKTSFTCWVRNLFKLQYFILSNYWRGSKLIFSFSFTVQKMLTIYKDWFGLMFWKILKVDIM